MTEYKANAVITTNSEYPFPEYLYIVICELYHIVIYNLVFSHLQSLLLSFCNLNSFCIFVPDPKSITK